MVQVGPAAIWVKSITFRPDNERVNMVWFCELRWGYDPRILFSRMILVHRAVSSFRARSDSSGDSVSDSNPLLAIVSFISGLDTTRSIWSAAAR